MFKQLEELADRIVDAGNKKPSNKRPWKKPVANIKTTTTTQDTFFLLKPYKENDKWIKFFQEFLGNFTSFEWKIDFFVVWNNTSIQLIAKVPYQIKNLFQNAFYTLFPTSELEPLKENIITKHNLHSKLKYIYLDKWDFKQTEEFKWEWEYIDPFKDILSLFYDTPWGEYACIKYSIQLAEKYPIRKKIYLFLKRVVIAWKNRKATEWDDDNKNNNYNKPEKNVKISWGYKWNPEFESNIKSVIGKFINNGKIIIKNNPKTINKVTIDQALNMFHMPTVQYFIKQIDYIHYRKLPYPISIPTRENSEKNDITLLWFTDFKSDNVKFGIRNEDKLRHAYIIWKTWMWKSTLMSNMIKSDMYTNKWLCVMDPHGDLIETAIATLPSWRTNDVVLFDVADMEYPMWFNIFEYKSEEEKHLVVSGIIWSFKKLYWESWGPRMEYILRNVLLALVEYPNATFLHLVRILTDKQFKEEVLEYVKDPIVLKFWRQEFDKRTDKFRDEAVSPIANKVGQFISSPIIRNIFWQPKSAINIREAMDQSKIILVNLSKWRIWDDNANMIGSFLVTKIQIDAMSRANIPARDRVPFYLYIDEFQNFATDSFESILSEARKYALSLIVANQYISQIQENVRNAIFGNVGSIISFQLGFEDAQIMSKQFKELISTEDILSISKFKAYLKLVIDGVVSDVFTMSTFPITNINDDLELQISKIRNQSRQRYAKTREHVENMIRTWAEQKFDKTEKAMAKVQEQVKIQGKKSIKDAKTWEWFDGFVKLKFNYGVFVNAQWLEWLLHKSQMDVAEWTRWKDFYEIQDKVRVKVKEIKEIDGEKKIVWTQK